MEEIVLPEDAYILLQCIQEGIQIKRIKNVKIIHNKNISQQLKSKLYFICI